MFVFSLFIEVLLDESSDRNSFRFPQVSIKVLSLELKILSYSVFVFFLIFFVSCTRLS